MKRLLLAPVFCLALAACATAPTAYGPSAGPSGVGFSEQKIESGRYRVTFRGGPGAPLAQVSDYALLRAADLAIADGYDWFRVVDRYTAQSGASSGPRVSIGAGGGNGGYRSGIGVGLGTSFDLGGGPSIIQTFEVLMGKGRPPPTGPDVYDAREVRNTIGARV